MSTEIDTLSDDAWERLQPYIPGGCKGKRGPRTNNRLFINALIWMARSGGRWRDLPERFGKYQSVKRRYYSWVKSGVFDRIFSALSEEREFDFLMIDSTVIRAHKHAAGAPRKRGMQLHKN